MSLMMSMMTASSTPPPAVESDPYYVNYVSLLPFNGADGSTSFQDYGGTVWAAGGTVQIDTAVSKFNGASCLFNGAGDYLAAAHSNIFNVTTGNFTAECWVRRSAVTGVRVILSKRPTTAGTSTGYSLFTDNGVLRFIGWDASFAIAINLTCTTVLSQTAFQHVAVSKEGTTWRLFVDGVLEASGVESAVLGTNTSSIYIGRDPTVTTRDWGGWIDCLRIAPEAVYTDTFTPPSSELPFGRTVSLLKFGGVHGSTVFTDEKGISWSVFGNARIDTSLGYNTGRFDGAGAYISAASNEAFGFGSGEYTVEALIVVQDVNSYQLLLDTRTNVLEGVGLYAYGSNAGAGADYRKMLYVNNAAILARSASNVPNTLVHLMYVRTGTTAKMFIGGIEQASVTDARTLAQASTAFIGANYTAAQFLSAYIKAMRITKGVARETSDFIPPTDFPSN